ncbi:MAG: MFS transporter [Chloroflexi bacterium]|nr:MFS transporter [Chloroflexota bacterium]
MKSQQLHKQFLRIKHQITHFTWGGAWALALPTYKQRNLTYFFYDGLFSAAGDKIILTYLTIYLLTLGVSGQQIGFLSSITNFSNALLLLPAAFLVEQTGDRKHIAIKSMLTGHLMIICMAVLPFFLLGSSALIWIMLALVILREAASNFAYPGWMDLTADIVPIEGRGRYFSSRNFIMGLASILITLLMGEFITLMGEPLGYQLAFLLAALFRIIAVTFFNRIKDPVPPQKIERHQESQFKPSFLNYLQSFLASIKEHPHFIRFIIYVAVLNFSIQISAPFFTVYMVETLHLTAAMIGVVTVMNAVANMLVQRRTGALVDQWGNRSVSLGLIFLIPLVSLIWGLWVHNYWQAIAVEIFSGLVWGGFNLVSFNALLQQTPEDQRARFSACYQIVVMLSLALGAGFGSLVFPKIEFVGVTLFSTAGRLIAALLFLFLVKDIRESKQASTG